MGTLIIKPEEQARIDERARHYVDQGFSFAEEFFHPVFTIKQRAFVINLMNFIHEKNAKLARSAENALEVELFVQKFEKKKLNGLVDAYRKTLKDKRTFDRTIIAMEQYAAFYIERDLEVSFKYETRDLTFIRWNGKRKVRFINFYTK